MCAIETRAKPVTQLVPCEMDNDNLAQTKTTMMVWSRVKEGRKEGESATNKMITVQGIEEGDALEKIAR